MINIKEIALWAVLVLFAAVAGWYVVHYGQAVWIGYDNTDDYYRLSMAERREVDFDQKKEAAESLFFTFQNGDLDRSRDRLREALAIKADQEILRKFIAVNLLSSPEHYVVAEAAVKDYIRFFSDDIDSRFWLLAMYAASSQGDIETAEQRYQQYLGSGEVDPRQASLDYSAALFRYFNTDEARMHVQGSLQTYPDDTLLLLTAGMLADKQSDKDQYYTDAITSIREMDDDNPVFESLIAYMREWGMDIDNVMSAFVTINDKFQGYSFSGYDLFDEPHLPRDQQKYWGHPHVVRSDYVGNSGFHVSSCSLYCFLAEK